MRLKNIKGLTLIETLISIGLLSVLVFSIMGAFYVSMGSTGRAKHRLAAMNVIRSFMEQEMRLGYNGGELDDYYATVTSGTSVPVTIDDRGTASAADDVMGALACDPLYPSNIMNGVGALFNFDGTRYKIIGFVVTWTDDSFGAGQGAVCSERAVTYVCEH